ncbi:MAG: universal stress protein [Woeseiaceae bacterium]|nr:universal stress protein [Woeseiaceae bacterium]
MADSRKIFVILDPTTMNQPSLVMGETIATDAVASGAKDTALYIYACIAESTIRKPTGMDESVARKEEQSRIESWVERLAAHSRSLGINVETEVEIHANWREAITEAVARQSCMLAIKNMTYHSRLTRRVRETSDWRLLRNAGCPLLLVKSYARRQINTVLVAMKYEPGTDAYEAANDRLLETGRTIANNVDAKLHVVAAYQGEHYPDRQKFADRCGLPRNQVKGAHGKPVDVIAASARELDADLVVIARVSQPGSDAKVGSTAEQVIDNLYCNTLVLPITS